MALLLAAKRLISLDASAGMRSMAAVSAKLPDLPYDFGALEPFISGKVRHWDASGGPRLACCSHSYVY